MTVQHTFSITGEGLPEGATVLAFRGSEAISKPYRVEAFLLVPEDVAAGFDPRAMLGQRATLSVHRDDGEVRRALHGRWSSVALVRSSPAGALFRAVLAPKLWRLSLARHSRVFVDRTAPQIVEAVLRECGFQPGEYAFQLERSYPPLEHVCQYRETYLDFLSRRLEHDGIYYYFQHPERGDRERLVITDSATFAERLGRDPVRFLPAEGDADGESAEGLRSASLQYASVPAGARTVGHNYLTPSAEVGGRAAVGDDDPFVVTSWEPVRNQEEGRRLAAIRAEELRAREVVLEGAGRSFDVRAGYLFELDEHPLISGEYLATAAEFRGCDVTAHRDLARALGFDGPSYEVAVTAVPGATQFRPERVTARPRAHGVELGVVRGPAESPYAQVDELGRYLVQLLFDEDASKRAPSTRMRMAQPSGGGNGTGFHFPLRNGTEVLVSFVRGDPDAPVIAGVVPNVETPSPVTEENATKNVVQTGGGNRLEIEDQEGREYVKWRTPFNDTYFHIGAPHNPQYSVDLGSNTGDGRFKMGDDLDIVVGNRKAEFVSVKAWDRYGAPQPTGWDPNAGAQNPAVYPDETHRVDVTGTRKTTVSGNVTEEYGADQVTAVAANRASTVRGRTTREHGPRPATWTVPTIAAGTRLWTKVHGDEERDVSGSRTVTVGGDLTETVSGAATYNVTSDWTVNVAGNQVINTSGAVYETKAEENVLVEGAETAMFGGARFELMMGIGLAIKIAATMEIQLGPKMETKLGLHLDMHQGLKVEATTGFKAEGGGYSSYTDEVASIETKKGVFAFTALRVLL